MVSDDVVVVCWVMVYFFEVVIFYEYLSVYENFLYFLLLVKMKVD